MFYVSYLLFQVLKKKQKGTGDYYHGCVPDPATLFLESICLLFHKKERVDFPAIRKSRTTNPDTTITIAQKFFVFFLQKRKVDFSTMFKQENQP